jgi:hypothetical protein
MPMLWAYAQLHIISKNVTGLAPWNFLTAGTAFSNISAAGGGGSLSHINAVTLKELMMGLNEPFSAGGYGTSSANPITVMGNNLRANAVSMIVSMVGIKVAQKLITKLGVTRSFNKLSDSVGMGSVIRA